MKKTFVLCRDDSGNLGLKAPWIPKADSSTQANTLAHDFMEHLGCQDASAVEDELCALGVMTALRLETGFSQRQAFSLRSEITQTLCDVWRDALEVPRVPARTSPLVLSDWAEDLFLEVVPRALTDARDELRGDLYAGLSDEEAHLEAPELFDERRLAVLEQAVLHQLRRGYWRGRGLYSMKNGVDPFTAGHNYFGMVGEALEKAAHQACDGLWEGSLVDCVLDLRAGEVRVTDRHGGSMVDVYMC